MTPRREFLKQVGVAANLYLGDFADTFPGRTTTMYYWLGTAGALKRPALGALRGD